MGKLIRKQSPECKCKPSISDYTQKINSKNKIKSVSVCVIRTGLLSKKTKIYTGQMDTEGLGGKLLLTLPSDPPENPEKRNAGTVTKPDEMLTLQARSSSLNSGTAKGRGKAFG